MTTSNKPSRRDRATRQAGVTLVEIMTVVVIMGVLASGAAIWLRTDPTPGASRSVASLMQEARRIAVAHGPIREDIVTALNLRATGRVLLSSTTSGPDLIETYELVEDPDAPDAAWSLVNSISLPAGVDLAGFVPYAVSEPSGTSPLVIVPGQPREILYYPDGSSDAATVFLRSTAASGDRYRIYVMPLAGVSAVARDW